MSKLQLAIAMSLDGYVAGPSQSIDNPLGIGGMGLHEWAFELEAWREAHGLEGGVSNPSEEVVKERVANVGATIMGRNMFGGHPGPWTQDEPWNGWWGDDPPFHHPVFVLTHHAREPLACEGGTTFTFVTDGIESALTQAREAAAGKDVSLAGGAAAARAVPRCGPRRRDGDQPRPDLPRRRRASLRRPRRRQPEARQGACGRSARRHPPEVRAVGR